LKFVFLAFYGGRVNATKLYYKVEGDEEEIRYNDVVSLYPSVNKFGAYPVGHPRIIKDNFEPMSATEKPYFGVVKCDILPPRRLYHPLLPVKVPGKLIFPLCMTCAIDRQQQTRCHHSDEERTLKRQAYCTPELYKALALGYRLIKAHEVWHYDEVAEFDETTYSGGLFSSYIDMFLKVKQEADGYPASCKTDADKDEYVRQYYEHERIHLDKSRIVKNPGLRAMAKLMLNSFWGVSCFLCSYDFDAFKFYFVLRNLVNATT
jgi:hypothetical protein